MAEVTDAERRALVDAIREANPLPSDKLLDRDFEEEPYRLAISRTLMDETDTGLGYSIIKFHSLTVDQFGTVMLGAKRYTPPETHERILQAMAEAVSEKLSEAVRNTLGEVRDYLFKGATKAEPLKDE